MKAQHKTLDQFADELEIARSTLQEYLKGKGNPTALMIEHMAEKLGIAPAVLLTGPADISRRDIILLILNSIHEVSKLPQEKRIRFAELFLELVLLWSESGQTHPSTCELAAQ